MVFKLNKGDVAKMEGSLKNRESAAKQEIKRLKVSTRNKVRHIIYSGENDRVQVLDRLRKTCSVSELAHVEQILREMSINAPILPEYFPKTPQVKENYQRLYTLPFVKCLDFLNVTVRSNIEILKIYFQIIFELNEKINSSELEVADNLIGEIIREFGYSHFLLRKAVLMKSIAADECIIPNVESVISTSGLSYNNHIVSSLIHCYQEDQDFLSIKRSIMSTKDRGAWNRFTRDILRLAFHPHAKDANDLSEMIQSNLQSSLVDAAVLAKINKCFYTGLEVPYLDEVFDFIDDSSLTIDIIAANNASSSEDLFYQRSSAWFEDSDVIKYRMLQDHFYDSSDVDYFEVNERVVGGVSSWVSADKIDALSEGDQLTTHQFPELRRIENKGTITRSAIFNYILHRVNGNTYISEKKLIELMGITSGLARTIDVEDMKNLAINLDSDISKIIIGLLVAKKSSNELDNHNLRRLIQNKVIERNNGKLVGFLDEMGGKSRAVATYTYEVCTEGFIARLSHIVKSSQDITETRSSLHRWMGKMSGEAIYFERARNLVIDHQINLVKDELDDNRIYVDTSRFTEWMEDEAAQDLSTLLLILEHNDELSSSDEPQLFSILEACYFEFCSNKYFGIASYLGRRIRHGTFKGHLYSDIVALETNSKQLLGDPFILKKWNQWKIEHEARIDKIVREKLHIYSSQKNDGFLNPRINTQVKSDIASACMKGILSDFKENRQVHGSLQIIVEYCWRIAEVDLMRVNRHFKGQKQSFMNYRLINEIKANAPKDRQLLAKEFERELQRSINEKLIAMYSWFKRPQGVAPKASIGLLYKAVVAEVAKTVRHFNPDTSFNEEDDVEIMGGAYHLLYDAFYVIVYNAAKHGKKNGLVTISFSVGEREGSKAIVISISSENEVGESDDEVNERLKLPLIDDIDDIDDAQLNEGRSGMRKLHHLERYDECFSILSVGSSNGNVVVDICYKLVF